MAIQIGESKTLQDIVKDLDTIAADLVIYVTSPRDWTGATVASLLFHPAGQYPMQIGILTYFLEVSIAREVVDVWKKWHNNPYPTLEEQINAIIHYANKDAYLR